MSLFGAMSTAISGLGAQSASFTNISDDLANSQTVGYKGVDTSFIDYLTTSTATQNDSGAVVARPDYTNDVQGTITQSSSALALAIAGQGFFSVSDPTGTTSATGQTSFSPQDYYTRAGDFSMNSDGYIVNSAGEYLNGWSVDPTTGVADQTNLAPIQINQSEFNPVATSNLTLSANLPATPTAGTPISSQVQIYDGLGNTHTVELDWTQNASNDWTVSVNVPDNTAGTSLGTAEVQFGSTSGNNVADGTVGSIGNTTGSLSANSFTNGDPATIGFTADFGNGPQTVSLNLGNYGQANGLTQYAGTSYDLRGITQDGVPAGAFSSVSTTTSGQIVVNYNNGQSRTVAQVPITTFNDPDGLQRQNGQSFTATEGSGAATTQAANTNGAGNLVTGSVESSNVDIATEFSSLIVAQQAYAANAKVVTSANQLLQTTINMIQ